jgi:hypothetical protein
MDYLANTVIENNPETIAAEAAARVAEHEAKKKFKEIWRMVQEQIQKTVKYFNLPSPYTVLDEVKELKNEAAGTFEKASEYGITSVIGRPLKIIKHIIDFSNNILHPTDDDSKSAKLISDLKKMGLPINLVLSEKAFDSNVNNKFLQRKTPDDALMSKLASVMQDQTKMENKLTSLVQNPKQSSGEQDSGEQSSGEQDSGNRGNIRESIITKNPSKKEMQELFLKKMMAQERMRQLMAERLRYLNYRPMYGGKRKEEADQVEKIENIFDMLINHRLWVLGEAKNIDKRKSKTKKRTIKKKKLIKKTKKTKKDKRGEGKRTKAKGNK